MSDPFRSELEAAHEKLRRVEEEVLRDHVAHCVEHAPPAGSQAHQFRNCFVL